MNNPLKIIMGTIMSLTVSLAAFAQLPMPSHGWNLGNTMEATCGVGCWGPPPNQALINSVAAAGFNTVRIPCAWMTHSNARGVIDSTYMAQVQQVVDWCYAEGLYVIINDHWDNGWFDNSNFNVYSKNLNSKMLNMWTQVANNFKNYDLHLLFACANEPPANTAAQTTVLYKYFQNFVTTVRGTGGNNAIRWLVVQAPSGNIDYAYNWVTAMPMDPANHTMLEGHFYDPWQFSNMTSDQSWGAMFYFWGAAYHTAGLASRNANWGEESYTDGELDKARSFVTRGIPVLLGEWRAEPKPAEPDLTGQYITQNYNSVTYWDYYFHNGANSRGMYCTCWDTPGQIFDWTTGAVLDQTQINALLGKSYVAPIRGL
jgi:aryl-phospho-beta-D-glucosidase BglC (GH1 family)